MFLVVPYPAFQFMVKLYTLLIQYDPQDLGADLAISSSSLSIL